MTAGPDTSRRCPPEASAKLVDGFQKLTWWDASAGALERIPAVASHIAFSVVMAEGFVRGRPGRWLARAIGGHFVHDFGFAGGAILLARASGSPLAGLALVPALPIALVVIRSFSNRG